jgi:ATP-binding cassette subfamily F protein 3
MASVEALVEALKEFEGTLCFISHDLYFINSLADHVAHVDKGKVTLYPGNYDYFQRRQAALAEEDSPAPQSHSPQPAQNVPSNAGLVKSSADDVRRLRESEKARAKARKKANARIREIEEEVEDLKSQMGSIFVQSDYKKLMELDREIKALENELTEKRNELDGIL